MQYRTNPKNGDAISVLGFGCMRFPKTAGVINQKRTEEVLKAALDAGVNYFDTAYIYPGSETALGKFLAKGYRNKIYLATKLPYRECKSESDAERIFTEQKKRLQTGYFDYYLIHMVSDADAWEKCRTQGIVSWAEEKKKSGEIRNLGFSYHGTTDGFKKLIDCYPWDFCQIQVNYADDISQAGVSGLKYAAAAGLPVFIMEPLRGGKLVNLPKAAETILQKEMPETSSVEFALRWLWNFPEVTCVLSGMNEIEQVLENTHAASDAKANVFSENDLAVYSSVKSILEINTAVPCTGCGYCMPCPSGVDIPAVFSAYNRGASEGFMTGLSAYISTTSMKEKPSAASACIKCGLCEKKCPQSILIRDYLDEAEAVMEGKLYRIAVALLKKYPGLMKWMTLML